MEKPQVKVFEDIIVRSQSVEIDEQINDWAHTNDVRILQVSITTISMVQNSGPPMNAKTDIPRIYALVLYEANKQS